MHQRSAQQNSVRKPAKTISLPKIANKLGQRMFFFLLHRHGAFIAATLKRILKFSSYECQFSWSTASDSFLILFSIIRHFSSNSFAFTFIRTQWKNQPINSKYSLVIAKEYIISNIFSIFVNKNWQIKSLQMDSNLTNLKKPLALQSLWKIHPPPISISIIFITSCTWKKE